MALFVIRFRPGSNPGRVLPAGYLSVPGTASTMARSLCHRSRLMFHGSIVALLTPFEECGRIDFHALQRLVSFHIEGGTSALVVAGTTGESATLDRAEFEKLLSEVIRLADGKIPIIAGTGSASTAHAVAQSVRAEQLGASASLVVTPYYNRPMQAGLVEHFKAVADAISIPVLMYNVPSRTSVDLLPETAAELSRHPGIVGLKEAVADIERVEYLVAHCVPGFVVLSGDDPSCLKAMKAGAQGVISVAANVAPREMSDLCAAAAAGDWEYAKDIEDRLGQLYETLALETNPIPVKWAAFEMGLIGPTLRLPLTPLDKRHRLAVSGCLERLHDARIAAAVQGKSDRHTEPSPQRARHEPEFES